MAHQAIELCLDYDPKASPRPRTVVRGKFPIIYMPKEYVDWKNGFYDLFFSKLKDEEKEIWLNWREQKTPLMIDVKFIQALKSVKSTVARTKRPDIDNLLKSILDAFKIEDSVFCCARSSKFEGPKRGIIIKIEPFVDFLAQDWYDAFCGFCGHRLNLLVSAPDDPNYFCSCNQSTRKIAGNFDGR